MIVIYGNRNVVGEDAAVAEYFKIAVENAMAIRNYDVIVTEHNDYFCKNADDRDEFPGLEERIAYRLVADRENERFSKLRFRRGIVDGSNASIDFLQSTPWELTEYANGRGIIRRLGRGDRDSVHKIPLEKFLPEFGLAAVELSTILGYPQFWVKPPTELVENAIRGNGMGTVKTLADGTRFVRIVIPKSGDPYRTLVIDPIKLVPTRLSKWQTKDGQSTVFFNQIAELEEVDGIFRPISLSIDRETFFIGNGGKRIPLNVVGTVAFDWIRVNVDDLQFPDIELLGQDILEWAKYLKIDPRSLSKETGKSPKRK